jgi:hypothetical protein
VPPHIAAWIERAVIELAPQMAKLAAIQAKIDDWHYYNPPPPKKPVDVSA